MSRSASRPGQDALRCFAKRGFVVVPNVIDTDVLGRANDEVDRVVAQNRLRSAATTATGVGPIVRSLVVLLPWRARAIRVGD